MYTNRMHVTFDSRSENERFARVTVAAFVTQLNPILEEISDIKTAVSEAVTNAIVHGYEGCIGTVSMDAQIENRTITITIHDDGIGIDNIEQAMQPLFTTKQDTERAGMGFMFMEAFMDELSVDSELGKGTTIVMKKKIPLRNLEKKNEK